MDYNFDLLDDTISPLIKFTEMPHCPCLFNINFELLYLQLKYWPLKNIKLQLFYINFLGKIKENLFIKNLICM